METKEERSAQYTMHTKFEDSSTCGNGNWKLGLGLNQQQKDSFQVQDLEVDDFLDPPPVRDFCCLQTPRHTRRELSE